MGYLTYVTFASTAPVKEDQLQLEVIDDYLHQLSTSLIRRLPIEI